MPGTIGVYYSGIIDEGRTIRPAMPPLTTRSFPSTTLSARQRAFYYCRAVVWRETSSISNVGKPSTTWSIVYDYLQCYLKQGESQFQPNSGLLVESDNLFTLDELHHHSSFDIQVGDAVQLLVGPTNELLRWSMCRGNQKISEWRADKAFVLMSKLPHKPGGIP